MKSQISYGIEVCIYCSTRNGDIFEFFKIIRINKCNAFYSIFTSIIITIITLVLDSIYCSLHHNCKELYKMLVIFDKSLDWIHNLQKKCAFSYSKFSKYYVQWIICNNYYVRSQLCRIEKKLMLVSKILKKFWLPSMSEQKLEPSIHLPKLKEYNL